MTGNIRFKLKYKVSGIKQKIKVIPVISFLMISCNDERSVHTLGETEHSFEEKVTSVSSGNNGTVWVGSETGRIWQVNGSSSEAFDVGDERIYKVLAAKADSDHSILWIGMRNSGLQKWNLCAKELRKLKTYPIPVKENKYSPYDIVNTKDAIYVATTQGLYRLSLSGDTDSLCLVYPEKKLLMDKYGQSFVVKNLLNYNDSILWASSEHGAIRLNLSDGKNDIFYPDLSVSHIAAYHDTLFVLADNKLLMSRMDGELLDSVKLQFTPKVYYQAANIHYLIDRDNMLISNDLKSFTLIPLRKKISDKCRNIILSDPKSDFTLLLMEDALWRIPDHTGIFSGNNLVKIACSDNSDAYYLNSGNVLYYQQGDLGEAIPVYTFPKEEQIVWMCSDANKLYYYNTEQEVKELTVSRFALKNQLMNTPELLFHSRHKITSAYLRTKGEKKKIYLGIQDGLLLLDVGSGKVTAFTDFSQRYVTSFFASAHTDLLYLSTLNSGSFYATSDTSFKSIPDTKINSSVKDLIVTGDYTPRLISLTNHDILSHASSDSLLARGCHKLLYVSDTLFYALSESGIQKVLIDEKGFLHSAGTYYTDIRFNPAASFVHADHLFLGSDMGVLIADASDINNSRWLTFKPNELFSVRNVLISGLLIIILLSFALFHYLHKRRMSKYQLIKRVAHLKEYIEELNSFYDNSDEADRRDIERLKQDIERINPDTQDRKGLNVMINQLTDNIIQRNRESSLRMLKKLTEQIDFLSAQHSIEKNRMLRDSFEVQKSNDIDRIRKQVRDNEIWIREYTTLTSELSELNQQMDGCITLAGVNDCMMQELARINEVVNKKSLSELQNNFCLIQKEYAHLFSESAFSCLIQFAGEMINFLKTRKTIDKVSEILLLQITKATKHSDPEDRIKLLKELESIHQRIEFIRIKDQIEECIESYALYREKIIEENDKLINKKFDKDLDCYIATQTKEFVEKTERLIVSMYKILNQTDPVILNDVLKISSFYHQQAKVLALLIANPRIKRSLIPGMLGIYGNLNPVISRLINNKIKINEEILKDYIDEAPLQIVFVYYIIKLID